MTNLSIPDRHRTILHRLASSDRDDLVSIVEALRGLNPSLAQDRLIEALRDAVPMQREEARDLLSVLLSIHSLPRFLSGITRENVVEEVISALRSSSEGGDEEADLQRLGDFLETALGAEPVAVTAKAQFLVESRERLLLESQVFTDLRPVFAEEGDDPGDPAVFLAAHTLYLRVVEGQEVRDLYVALDDADLEKLSSDLRRARAKEAALQERMELKGLRVLSAGKGGK